jgi:hypothetical protein
MKPNRRRRLILWSLGMGMVAAFIQSRLAAARMALSEPSPDCERDRPQDVESVGLPHPVDALCVQAWRWTDQAEVSLAFRRLGTRSGASAAESSSS